MQPAGKPAQPTQSFPSTKAHFDLLRSLDPNKARIKGLNLHTTTLYSRETVGVELIFSNGQSILLGGGGNKSVEFDFSRKVKQIFIEKRKLLGDGITISRFISFYDGINLVIGSNYFHGPLFEEEVPKQTITEGYELIGMSVTI